MKNSIHNNPRKLVPYKDKQFTLAFIRKAIENGTGMSFEDFYNSYSEIERYYWGLYFVTTTNKALCEAIFVPVEAGTRYKKTLHSDGCLLSSVKEYPCPFTGHFARFLSTSPDGFDELFVLNNNQLSFF